MLAADFVTIDLVLLVADKIPRCTGQNQLFDRYSSRRATISGLQMPTSGLAVPDKIII
jgi:hypothetical protein